MLGTVPWSEEAPSLPRKPTNIVKDMVNTDAVEHEDPLEGGPGDRQDPGTMDLMQEVTQTLREEGVGHTIDGMDPLGVGVVHQWDHQDDVVL